MKGVAKMYEITYKNQLSEKEFDFWLKAPLIAQKACPGQFVILRMGETGERIPLTIVDTDESKGEIRLIIQVVGTSTTILSNKQVGDFILDVVGPLGEPTKIKSYGKVMVVGGGVGIAAIYPIMKGLKQAGNEVVTILGAKTAKLIILAEECEKYSNQLIINTDDGSLGEKGLVTTSMERILMDDPTIQCIWAIGPGIMMKFCTMTASSYNVPIYVSLNPIMIDGTGMCGGCRVTVGESTKFACVDGPEFLGNEVNWDEFLLRLQQYGVEEKCSYEAYLEEQVNN